MKINVNTLLLILGALGFIGPDLDKAAAWLAASGIPHVVGIVHVLAFAATACAGLALAVPYLRKWLSLGGLATPPGAQAPWIAGKDNVVPMAGAVPEKKQAETPVTVPITPRKMDKGIVDFIAGGIICLMAAAFLLAMCWSGRAQAQTPTPDPFAGHCFGDNCLTLEGAITGAGIFLNGSDAGKLVYGVNVSGGYALLFGYSNWWASGPSIHGALQSGTNPATGSSQTSVEVMFGATILRYLHLGVEHSFLSNGPAEPWIFIGALSAPIDVLTTKGVATKKAFLQVAGQAAQ